MVENLKDEAQLSSKNLDAERFFALTNELMAIIDEKGYFLRVNGAWASVLGYESEELVGQPVAKLLHPDSRAAITTQVKRLWAGEQEASDLECRAIPKGSESNEAKWISWSAVVEKENKLLYLVAHDITERKQIEHDWKNAHAALENAIEGIARVDAYGRFTAINKVFAEHLGYREQDLLGSHWHVSVHPEDAPKLQSAQELMLETGKAELEARGIRSDGSLSHSQIVLVKALDQNENYIGHHCFMKDISARKEAELSLQKTESRLLGLLSHVPGILYQVMAPDKNTFYFSYVSESCRHILGYEPEEFTQNKDLAYSCIHAEDVPRLRELMRKSAKEMQPFRAELRCYKKSGELVWVLLSSSPERLSSNEIIWNGLLTDITESKQSEEKIKQLNEDLAQRIQVLATVNEELETLTRKLEIAYGQAMEASKVKSEFVANISHEVRTPISAVIGMSELLIDSFLNPEQEQLARIISESAQSLLTIINDILDFSKMEAGRIELESISFSVTDVIKGCSDWLETPMEEKGLSMLQEIDPTIPAFVKGDPLRIRQVLLNLITNAMKFTAKGYVKVRATLVSKNEGQAIIKFEVIDTGIGLTEPAHKRLFKPFSQADGSTTRKYGGTGLGLSISKHLVELMGGEIGVESQEGAGSTFWFTLPLSISSVKAFVDEVVTDASTVELNRVAERNPLETTFVKRIKRFEAALLDRPVQTHVRSGAKVLLAEDNPVLQELASRQLRRLGLEVDVVSNGREAVEAMAKTNYDLIFMDCQMPEKDGFEATLEIRQQEKSNKGTHRLIVALTASAMESDRAHCLACGMDDYMSKPVRLRQLIDIIEKWIPSDSSFSQGEVNMAKENEYGSPTTAADKRNGTAGNTGDTCLDVASLQALYGEESTQEILSMFLEESTGLLKQMQDHLVNRHGPGLASASHQLKGVSASVMAERLSKQAGKLEMTAKQSNWSESEEILSALTDEMSKLTKFVKTALDNPVPR
jgi:PAS domain S-box-containing protein